MKHRAEEVPPLEAVERLSRCGETGRLSWSTDSLEASVYLQKGRVAWANSSASTFSLGRELARRAGVDAAKLREIIESSRGQRRSLGRALSEAGVAPLSTVLSTVREVLRDHIAHSLGSLATCAAEPAVFTHQEPDDLAYDDMMTFSFDEVASNARRARRSVTADFMKPALGSIDVTKRSALMNLKESLAKIMEIDGAVGCCAVDSNSGMMLGSAGGGAVNLEVAAAGNTDVVRAKRKTIKALGLHDAIDDILITLGKQYHLIRPLASNDALFVYLVLDKARGNLAMARHQLTAIERELSL